jgi:hypothetical protein
MKLYLAIVLTLNLFAMSILWTSPTKSIESSLAKMVVRENIEKIPEIGSDETLRFSSRISSSECADAGASKGLVTGRGQAVTTAQHIDGVPVYRSTQFSYRAMVSAACDYYNLNCYGVDTLDVAGTTSVTPRL